jgi:hypothetical protein
MRKNYQPLPTSPFKGEDRSLEKNLLSPHGERTKVRGGVMDNLPSIPSLVRRGGFCYSNNMLRKRRVA